MSTIPDDIKRHRLPGTEIKKVGNTFYMQRVKCVWDPAAKKRKKLFLGFIGAVTAEGVAPRKTRKVSVDEQAPRSKEFGASWVAREVSGDVLEALQKHFPDDARWIYAAAVQRCVHPSAMRYLEHKHEASYMSEAMPGLDLRSEQISARMKALGGRRAGITAFMRSFVPSEDWHVIFDGTSLVCDSKRIGEAQIGRDSCGGFSRQINLMYALAVKDGGIAPVFYKRYPGSIKDVSAFRNMTVEMGLKSALVIADKGFTKKEELDRLEAAGLSYIMPLRRNSTAYSREALEKPGRTGFHGRFRHNGRTVWFHCPPPGPSDTNRSCLFLDESLQYAETLAHAPGKIGDETPEQLRLAAQRQLGFGTFVLKTNLLDATAEEIYRTYKTREEIEQLFDTYKSEEQFATTGMHSSETQEACLFLNHLSVMIAYRVYARLKANGRLKEYAVQKTLEHLLKDIRVTHVDGAAWQFEPITKAARLALEAIGLTLPESPR